MKKLKSLSCLVVLLAVSLPAAHAREPYDHSAWTDFLQTYVNEDGMVDYAAVKANPEKLNKYLDQVALIDEYDLKEWPREEALALYLNLYHAAVVKLVIEHYPLENIQQIAGVWDLPTIRIGEDGYYSLNKIHRDFLMGGFRDEKIHTAVSCGAKSCPKMPREAYDGIKVEGQLYLAARDFANDVTRNKIIPGDKKVYISRILKWYASDFNMDFGFVDTNYKFSPSENAVLSFLAYYSDDPAKIEYLEEREYKVDYLPFDWSLNEARFVSAAQSSS